MKHWYMITLVGKDRSGIVAKVSNALYQGGCNLGETSMMRLGGNFTMMMMVESEAKLKDVKEMIQGEAESMGLHLHIDHIEAKLHQHMEPDVDIAIYGADKAGIVAHATGALAEAGLHILDLTTVVAGSEDKPIYILQIEGHAAEGIEALESALAIIKKEGVDVSLSPIETMIG